jgi:hypothetical protein
MAVLELGQDDLIGPKALAESVEQGLELFGLLLGARKKISRGRAPGLWLLKTEFDRFNLRLKNHLFELNTQAGEHL